MWMLLLLLSGIVSFFFFFKQKTAYEMRISDWSSDVCSSDLHNQRAIFGFGGQSHFQAKRTHLLVQRWIEVTNTRSEEHTSELQSLMRISYAVFCLKKKKTKI